MKNIFYSILMVLCACGVVSSCIEDGFTTSPSDQPTFSVDTLDMGVIFTEEMSTTHQFTVYNRASKSIEISNISLSGENAELFRLNVDGFSGTEFSSVEIRANDSILVFVETTLPANGKSVPVNVEASLDFVTNGVKQSVVLSATGRDVVRLTNASVFANTRFVAGKPYQIYGSLTVEEGVTLTIDPGAELYFHDGAMMIVRGTLKAIGTPEAEITLAGDRTGYVASDIPFDLMSEQWVGLFFTSTSRDNELSYACVRNTNQGVTVNGSEAENGVPTLTMINSRLRNSRDYALEVIHGNINAYGCEFAEAGIGAVSLTGGEHVFNHCTLANYYLFTAISGSILELAHLNEKDSDDSGRSYLAANFTNCIIYGLGTDLSHGDLKDTNVYLRRCLLKSNGTDDDNFIDCVWGADPLYRTVRSDYYFDYRLKADSPAIQAADAALTLPQAATDRYGLSRGTAPDLGAYVYQPE